MGSFRVGWFSMGVWLGYGLGLESENFLVFMVLVFGGSDLDVGKNGWGSGFLLFEY